MSVSPLSYTPIDTRSMSRLARTLTIVLATGLLSLTAAATPADTSELGDDPAVEKVKLLRLLNSGNVDKQERALRLIGHYAHTDQYDEDFYRIMVTPLHGILAETHAEALQIMAVSALYSIGTDHAFRGLEAQVSHLESARVTKVTESALAHYEAPTSRVN